MARAVWNVDVNGTSHEIELKWTYFGGDRDVFVDGTLVQDDDHPMRWQSKQMFVIDGEQFSVVTKPQTINIAAFDIELHHNNQVLKPDIDER